MLTLDTRPQERAHNARRRWVRTVQSVALVRELLREAIRTGASASMITRLRWRLGEMDSAQPRAWGWRVAWDQAEVRER